MIKAIITGYCLKGLLGLYLSTHSLLELKIKYLMIFVNQVSQSLVIIQYLSSSGQKLGIGKLH